MATELLASLEWWTGNIHALQEQMHPSVNTEAGLSSPLCFKTGSYAYRWVTWWVVTQRWRKTSEPSHTHTLHRPAILSHQQMCELLAHERRQWGLMAEANTLIYSCFLEVHQRIKAFCLSLTRIDPNHHIRSSISIHISPKPSISSSSSLSAFNILKEERHFLNLTGFLPVPGWSSLGYRRAGAIWKTHIGGRGKVISTVKPWRYKRSIQRSFCKLPLWLH